MATWERAERVARVQAPEAMQSGSPNLGQSPSEMPPPAPAARFDQGQGVASQRQPMQRVKPQWKQQCVPFGQLSGHVTLQLPAMQ
jgi:hypothetical protein